MNKYKVNNSKWTTTSVQVETITREQAIQEIGIDAVNELDRDAMLGVRSSIVVKHSIVDSIKFVLTKVNNLFK